MLRFFGSDVWMITGWIILFAALLFGCAGKAYADSGEDWSCEMAKIQIEEARQGWWSPGLGGQSVGGQFEGTLPGSEGQEFGILNGPELGYPQMWTVNLFRSDRQVETPANSDVRARLIVGTGGISNVFDVDFANGVQFSIPAISVRVTAVTFRPTLSLPYAPTSGIRLGAFLGRGGCPAQNAQFTSQRVTINGGGASFNFPIPDYARTWLAFSTQSTLIFDPLLTYSLQSAAGINLLSIDGADYGNNYRPLPIVAGTAALVVANGTAGAGAWGVVWGLGL